MIRYCLIAAVLPLFCAGLSLQPRNVTDTQNLACGEVGGGYFDDSDYFRDHGFPTEIIVHSGDVIDSIQLKYGEEWAPKHGGGGGGRQDLILNGAKITGIRMYAGKISIGLYPVCEITFIITGTNGETYPFGPFGRCDRDNSYCGEFYYNEGMKYIAGYSGDFLDQLQTIFI